MSKDLFSTSPSPKKRRRQKWSKLFSKSSMGPEVYFLRGTAGLDDGFWKENLLDGRLGEIVIRLNFEHQADGGGISALSSTWGSEETFKALDGKIEVFYGNGFYGRRGVWVVGRKLFRLMCHELFLTQPLRSKEEVREGPIPTHLELLEMLE